MQWWGKRRSRGSGQLETKSGERQGLQEAGLPVCLSACLLHPNKSSKQKQQRQLAEALPPSLSPPPAPRTFARWRTPLALTAWHSLRSRRVSWVQRSARVATTESLAPSHPPAAGGWVGGCGWSAGCFQVEAGTGTGTDIGNVPPKASCCGIAAQQVGQHARQAAGQQAAEPTHRC